MGAGKSSVAPLLARCIDLPVRDIDSLIEKKAGRSVSLIFSELGESRFRDLEFEMLEEVLEHGSAVIAAGGGTLCDPAAWRSIRAAGALTVFLSVPPRILSRRVTEKGRPLLAGAREAGDREERLHAILLEREAWFRRCDIHIDASRDLGGVVNAAREAVLDALQRSVHLRLGSKSHCFWLRDSLRELGEDVARRLPPDGAARRCALICDDNVLEVYGETATESLRAAGYCVRLETFRPGESQKNLETVGRLIDGILSSGHQRGGPIVALGGGVTGDVAGFVGAILHRGCPVIQVPTTLLAMIDSSIGGKTGVNHSVGKNLIGSFHQPVLTCAPLDTLHSLGNREFLSGLAEMVKVALLERGWSLLSCLEKEADQLVERDMDTLREVVKRCVSLKADLVCRDPLDLTGSRRLLNLGHTLGHALEAGGDYDQWTHGEAVGLGLMGAARVGASIGSSPEDLEQRLGRLLAGFGLPSDVSPLLSSGVLSRVMFDKKCEGAKIGFVVPIAGGGAKSVPLSVNEIEFHMRSSRRGAST